MRRLLLFLMLLLIGCTETNTPLPSTQTPGPIPPTLSLPTPLPSTSTPIPIPLTDTPSNAATFPDPNSYTWQLLVSGLERPVDLQVDGSGRLFVIEKIGRIRIIENGQLLETAFLDVSDRVGSSSNEQGLLGLAFHPQYAQNGRFFVNYTDKNGDTSLSRFQVTDDPNIADPASEVQLLGIDQPFGNHNGGVLVFDQDGYLYAGLGDGGSQGDPFGNAQNTDVLLGKILRLDVDSAEPYGIPADNPFDNEIWHYGLRNPWRISFDRATGDLYIADVGGNAWEEIDFLEAGSSGGVNFGWDHREGAHDYEGGGPEGMVDPVTEYSHSEGGCSVTGGHVYRGETMPEWSGIYLYADYCTGFIWGLIRSDSGWQNQMLFDTDINITSFGQDDAGEIYLVGDRGEILRLAPK